MIASYILSSTFVPVMSVWLLRSSHHAGTHGRASGSPPGGFGRSVCGPAGLLIAALGARARSISVAGGPAVSSLGRPARHGDLPAGGCRAVPVPAARPRPARASSRPRRSRRRPCDFIGDEVGPAARSTSRSATSASCHSSYPINTVYLWMGGPEESVIRVALKPGAGPGRGTEARLREKLPDHLRQWTAEKWQREGVPADGRRAAAGGSAAVVRAGRHRQRGDELRLADADRGGGLRAEDGRQPRLRREGLRASWRRFRRWWTCATPSRSTTRRSRSSIDREKSAPTGATASDVGPVRRAVHLVEPLHRAELLARSRLAASATRSRSRSRSALVSSVEGSRTRTGRQPRARTGFLLRDVGDGQGRDDARARSTATTCGGW